MHWCEKMLPFQVCDVTFPAEGRRRMNFHMVMVQLIVPFTVVASASAFHLMKVGSCGGKMR